MSEIQIVFVCESCNTTYHVLPDVIDSLRILDEISISYIYIMICSEYWHGKFAGWFWKPRSCRTSSTLSLGWKLPVSPSWAFEKCQGWMFQNECNRKGHPFLVLIWSGVISCFTFFKRHFSWSWSLYGMLMLFWCRFTLFDVIWCSLWSFCFSFKPLCMTGFDHMTWFMIATMYKDVRFVHHSHPEVCVQPTWYTPSTYCRSDMAKHQSISGEDGDQQLCSRDCHFCGLDVSSNLDMQ